jgi:hypothetical protein
MDEKILDSNNIAADLLYNNSEEVRSIAWSTADRMPGGRTENMLIVSICDEPWEEFIYGMYPEARAQASAVRQSGQSPVSICSVSISSFAEYLKDWTVDIPMPEAPLEEEMIWVLVLHELGFVWVQVQATPPANQLS